MPILVRNVRLGLDESEDALLPLAAKRLRVPVDAIQAYAVVRRSLDARKTTDTHFTYQLELELAGGSEAARRALKGVKSAAAAWIEPATADLPTAGAHRMSERPIVIGFGPAGMFAAIRLARFGYRPIVLERGRDVQRRHRDVLQRFYRERRFDPTSNLLFGEGGAGTYSDGKLYTRINDPLGKTVLETFYQHGADPDILIDARPHIGSDRLPTICTKIRKTIERLGGEVRFECQMDDIRVKGGKLTAIHVRPTGEDDGGTPDAGATRVGEWLPVDVVVLAVGHSARDTLRMLHGRGVSLETKPFQVGVRIEHPQAMVDRWQFGALAGHQRLGPAEYHVVAKRAAGEGDMFSFCMCPGGVILPTNESPGLISTNGASRASRSSPFANSGLVVTLDPGSIPADGGPCDALAALAFLESWERRAFQATGGSYRVPAQRACDFLEGRASDGTLETSYPLGGQWADVAALIPPGVADALRRALPMIETQFPDYAGSDAVITAPETRASSPVRIPRDRATRRCRGVENLFPVGEGAGYAGGIISAAVDGIRAADSLIRHYAPPG